MSIKLIAFDLDGTLLNKDHQLAAKTIEAVEKVRQKGIRTLVATGRMYCSAKPHIKKLGMEDPIITYNGALVVDPKQNSPLFHEPIPKSTAKKITEMVVKNNYYLQLYIDDNLFVAENNKFTEKYGDISGIKAEVVGRLDKFIDDAPTKMLIIEENEKKQKQIHEFLAENFGDEIEISSSYPIFIEITKKGMSKAVPLKNLSTKMGIKQSEVMAFGDGLNDLKMIKWAGKGVAMGNADPKLRQAADDIALEHHDLGIAKYLKDEFKLDLELDN